ncbi:MAG TPA: serine/threonine-protein kinase [Polyangiaceae bacterium]|nr:serine/threonine-protein kinase [Polyangiaceae bacterium]
MSFDYAPGDLVACGRFRVTRVLASGGMGSVYEVEDVGIGRAYVLKTLHRELAGEGELRRQMEREARVLGRLSHPNVVQVFTAGVTDDELSLPFIVMERLRGGSLREVLRGNGGLPARAAVRVAIELLDALDQLHEIGVVHCDLKPENVFLHATPRGEVIPKLLDFGVARVLPRGEAKAKLGGTVRYSSPEQLRGEEVDARSDVYAMALVLYEMLAGTGPFADARGAENVARAQLTRVPGPIKGVPAPLMALLGRALAKKPSERPRDAFAFAHELREIEPGLLGASAVPSAMLEVRAKCDETTAHAPNAAQQAATAVDRSDTVRDVTSVVSSGDLLTRYAG